MDKYFSLGQVARLLGVQPYKITYGHATGKLREPARVLGKRAYRPKDLTALADFFGVKLSTTALGPRKEKEDV